MLAVFKIKRSNLFKITLVCLWLSTLLLPITSGAQELISDRVTLPKAQVLEVESQKLELVPGTGTYTNIQHIKVEILSGIEKGKIVTVENDYFNLRPGEKFYLRTIVRGESGETLYSVGEQYRLPWVLFFVALFVLVTLVFGGWQGARGLVSLAGSLLVIIYVLLPGILAGYSPILISLGVASVIIILGSYVTHGFNKTTTAAVVGMITTVTFTGLLAWLAVYLTKLSGFSAEEAVHLNFSTGGSIDFVGLLLSGILIGLLGVLYDAAISQAISVEELHKVAPHLPRRTIFAHAIRIGREHIGALVNTLAIAYVGVSLPLLLLYLQFAHTGVDDTMGIAQTLNREIFATEIVRTMLGSIGLILAVPFTTLVATWMLMRVKRGEVSAEKINAEKEALVHFEHHH